MKKLFLLKSLLLLCALVAGSSSVWADTWTKVTSTDQLVSGKDYLLVSQNGEKSLGALTVGSQTNKDYYGTTAVTASSDKNSITDEKSAHILTLGGTTGEWTFYDNTDKKYVSLLIDGNYVNQSASVSGNNEKWTISISSGVATITSKYKDARMLQYNASSSRWACYKSSSSQQDGVLYVKETSSSPLASIALSGSYPTSFAVGDEFSHEGMVVTATYADESTSVVTNKAEFTGYNMSTTGTQTVTVSYTENEVTKTANYSIKVKPVAGLAFSPASVDIAPGEEKTVSFSKTTDATPSFVVADETIATYNSSTGKVVGLKEGTTTITATTTETETYAAGEAVCTITVTDPTWIDFTKQGYTNAENVETVNGGNGSVTFNQGTNNQNSPKWYDSGSAIRVYQNNTITINAKSGFVLTSVEFSVTSGSMSADKFSASVTKVDNTNEFKLAIPASEITYTPDATVRIDKVKINIAAPVTMNQYEWTTFVSDKALNFEGTDVTAYIVTGHTGNALNKTEVTKVAAGTPLLLNADADNYNIPVIAFGTTYTDNKLQPGTGAAVSAESDVTRYVLSKNPEDTALSFMKIVSGTPATVPVGKAYLEFDGEIPAPVFGFGEATAIEKIANSEEPTANGQYYNLNGQRVAQPTKGLYIVNGKKVIIK